MSTSGRPKGQAKTGGRKKGSANLATREIRELAQEHGPEAIAKAASLMKRSRNPDIVLRAVTILLDRGYGKPAQALHHAGHDGEPLRLESMNLEELKQLATRLEHTLALSEASGGNAGDD